MRKFLSKQLYLMFTIGFLYASEGALLSYINSTFLTQNFGLGTEQVGLLFSAGSIISILLLAIAPKYVYRFGKQKILIGLSLITALCIFLVSNIAFPYAAIMFILFLAGNQAIWYVIDISIESGTVNSKTGKTRGFLLTLLNAAWLVFPALAAQLLGKGFSPSTFYTWTAISLVAIAFLALFRHEKNPLKEMPYSKISRVHLSTFFKDKRLSTIFSIRLFLDIFYAVMVIYTPLYLRTVQLIPWSEIVGIFFVMFLPFVLVEFPVGYLADRKFRESDFLRIGFIIMAISMAVFLYMHSNNWIIWAIILFVSRVGAAMIEISTESAFFKMVDPTDIKFISVFRSISPTSYIVTPIFASLLISFSGEMIVAFIIPLVLSVLGIIKSRDFGKMSQNL